MFEAESPRLSELVTVRELQPQLAHIFRTPAALEWELRLHRAEYVEGGALFIVARRLLAHPPTFEKIALRIGARKVATRSHAEPSPA